MKRVVMALLLLATAACAPRLQPPGVERQIPHLTENSIVTQDGYELPLRVWRAGDEQAVAIALHGFNDYSNAFSDPAPWWAERGVTIYAYDQRGFGETEHRGLWPGIEVLTSDLETAIRLVRARHPGKKLFVIGDSMGGAVAMRAMAQADAPAVDGMILSAPAVWGRATMNWFYRGVLWAGAHAMPWNMVTPPRQLRIRPSDNLPMLLALGRDPLVIKRTRVDAIWGLVNLMDAALAAASELDDIPVLLLYGARDEIIPKAPVDLFLSSLAAPHRVALYPNGYHMLFRDLQREVVWRDALSWMLRPNIPLPSGYERNGGELFAKRESSGG